MSEKQTPTLLEAIQSGKCFNRDNPSLRPRPCTFMEAWEHMKKYPGQEVCIWKNLRCRNVSGDIFDHLDDDLFENHFACTIIDSNEWKLIPQEEGE